LGQHDKKDHAGENTVEPENPEKFNSKPILNISLPI